MPTVKRLTIENVNLDDDREMDAFDDQVIAEGMERVRAEGDQLRRKGLLDGQARRSSVTSRERKRNHAAGRGW